LAGVNEVPVIVDVVKGVKYYRQNTAVSDCVQL